jgi:hypothetical protein
MSVKTVAETWRGRTGSSDAQSFTREYTAVYVITSDDPFDNATTIGGDYRLPQKWYGYPSDPFALCINVDLQNSDESPRLWLGTYKYSTSYSQQQDDNPLNRPVLFSLSFSAGPPVIVTKDINGNVITNTSGDPFDPPFTIDDSRPLLACQRNEATIPTAIAIAYKDAVNADAWNGTAVGQCKMKDISTGQLQTENGYQFYTVTYQIEFNAQGWQYQPLNVGFRTRTNTGGTAFIPGATRPQLLKGTLIKGVPDPMHPESVITGGAQFLAYDVYPKMNYAALNLV